MLTALSELLSTVIENHRLRDAIKRNAADAERQRLAREMHDSITQSLYSQTMFARASRYALEDRDFPKLGENLLQLESSILGSLKEMRLLLFQMQPQSLENDSLADAIQRRFQSVEQRLNILTDLHFPAEFALDPELNFELYRIVLEALNNSLRHAAATAVVVQAVEESERYLFTIRDNGVGFDLATVKPGMGLRHMMERAGQIHASVEIDTVPGGGTKVTICLPKWEAYPTPQFAGRTAEPNQHTKPLLDTMRVQQGFAVLRED